MNEIFNVLLLQNTLRTATPVIIAGLGCLLTQHVNMTNIGIEGMMLLGAFFAVFGSYTFGSFYAGLLFAVGIGLLCGLIYYIWVVVFESDEFIIGVAFNLLAAGLTVYLLRTLFDVKGSFSDPAISPLPTITIPFISNIPFLGDLLSGHTLLVYVSWILVFVLFIVLYKTPFGFHLRATGENPSAISACGLSPLRYQRIASILCGGLASLAGAHLSLGYLTMFSENMTAARGYVAFACVILGRGNPILVSLAALLFGFIDALGLRMQRYIPNDITAMAPYLITIIMMIISVRIQHKKKGR